MSDVDTLARTAWGEERSLGKEAMTAVCNVVLNRVKLQGWRGLTITEVCLKPGQFDCWLPSDPNYQKMRDVTISNPRFAMAMQIATSAVAGTLVDNTGGATYYYNTTIPEPYWARGHTPCAMFDTMICYNDIA